jgi:hypothetical protein
MLGLPLTAWIMIVLAGGIGMAIEVSFLLQQRRRRNRRGQASGNGQT